jgi:hypothetical protein
MTYKDAYDIREYYNPETGRPCSYEEYSYIMNRLRGYHHSPNIIQPKQQITWPSVESKSENTKNKLLLLL